MTHRDFPLHVGYVLARYPCRTETFIAREIEALLGEGDEVSVFALRKTEGEGLPVDVVRAPSRLYYRKGWNGIAGFSAGTNPEGRPPVSRAACLRALGRALGESIRSGLPGVILLRNVGVARAFAHAAWRIGATHFHAHFAFTPLDIARLMAGMVGASFSVSLHARDLYTQKPGRLRRRLRGAAGVAVCTQSGLCYLRDTVQLRGAARLEYVPHGVFVERFPRADPSTAGACLVAIGRLVPKKGFACLLEACAHLRAIGVPFRCVIVGTGPEEIRLRRRLQALGLLERVSLLGARSHADTLHVLRQACALVVPSVVAPDGDRDGLPNVVLEAMAVGIPVIATKASAAGEAVTDGENGFLVPPANPRALADAMQRILSDDALRARLGEAGRHRVANAFDISRNIRTLRALFQVSEPLRCPSNPRAGFG